MKQGAVPGEGPREGWHGGKAWAEARQVNAWNLDGYGGQGAISSNEWSHYSRPTWSGTDLGEEIPQRKSRPDWTRGENAEMIPPHYEPMTDWQYTGFEYTDKPMEGELHGVGKKWDTDAKRGHSAMKTWL